MNQGEEYSKDNGICRVRKKFVAFENVKERSLAKVMYSEQGSEVEH